MREPGETSGPGGTVRHIAGWLCLFGLAYAGMQILPTFLRRDITNDFRTGDLLGVFAPFVVVPVAWRTFLMVRAELGARRPRTAALTTLLLMFSSLLYAQGQGMNLAANAVARHLVGLEGTSLYRLDYLFDETLGHLLWHTGVVGISLALILLAQGLAAPARPALTVPGGIAYGFTYFTDGVEGQTVPLLLPAAVLMSLWLLSRGRWRLGNVAQNPVWLFFLVGAAVALTLFAVWRIWQGSFVQFSELGWI